MLPTVSWHREEYDALGVDFTKRGRLLDEHLAAWRQAWGPSPVSHRGKHYAFEDVWFEPKAWRPDGPRIWLGGGAMTPKIIERIVHHGHGFNPLGRRTDEEMEALRAAMAAAGRDMAELELVGGTRAVFTRPDSVADLALALEAIPPQIAQGFTRSVSSRRSSPTTQTASAHSAARCSDAASLSSDDRRTPLDSCGRQSRIRVSRHAPHVSLRLGRRHVGLAAPRSSIWPPPAGTVREVTHDRYARCWPTRPKRRRRLAPNCSAEST